MATVLDRLKVLDNSMSMISKIITLSLSRKWDCEVHICPFDNEIFITLSSVSGELKSKVLMIKSIGLIPTYSNDAWNDSIHYQLTSGGKPDFSLTKEKVDRYINATTLGIIEFLKLDNNHILSSKDSLKNKEKRINELRMSYDEQIRVLKDTCESMLPK